MEGQVQLAKLLLINGVKLEASVELWNSDDLTDEKGANVNKKSQ